MSQKLRYKITYFTALVVILMLSAYYHISNERMLFLHGKLIFPPLVITLITVAGMLPFRKQPNKVLDKGWRAVNAFALVIALAVGVLCAAGFQPYLPFVEINVVLNFAISPLPFTILPLVCKALFSSKQESPARFGPGEGDVITPQLLPTEK